MGLRRPRRSAQAAHDEDCDSRAVARTPNGEVYVAGDTRGTLPGQTNAGLSDAFLRKYDLNGNEVWTRQYGAPLNDSGSAVAASPQGSVCVAGRSEAAQPGQTFAGGSGDAYVKCFDSNGQTLWTSEFGTPGSDLLLAVALDRHGDVYVAGQTSGTLPGQTSSGNLDAFVRKYDAAGNELWNRQFGSPDRDVANGISVDPKGDVYVVGTVFAALPGQPPVAGASDAFIRKLDSAGNELWTRQFGSSLVDTANAVSTVPTGDVYVAGSVSAALPGHPYAGGSSDAFVRKYDRDGNEVWTQVFGTATSDNARAVSVDSTGTVYVAGEVGLALPGQTSAGNTDAFVRMYDRDGNEVWTLQFGSPQRDSIGGGAVHESGEVIGVGDTDGAVPSNTSAGEVDAFVVKIVKAK